MFPMILDGPFYVGLTKVEAPGYFMKLRFDLLGVEIFGILVLDGAGVLITKKRS